ncbi:MAG: hypothetical protein JNK05_26485 [Myxococcales bacterium]|nr:hypothetical protein [Myxococcales bacterium]
MVRKNPSILIACVIACVSLVSREATACRAEALPGSDPATAFDVCGAYKTTFYLATVGGLLAIPSVATHVGIIAWYARTSTVPLAWPVTGVVLWSAHTGLSSASLALSVRTNDSGGLPISIAYFAASASSLAVSVAALFAPRPLSLAPRVALAPWWTREGAGLTLGGAF